VLYNPDIFVAHPVSSPFCGLQLVFNDQELHDMAAPTVGKQDGEITTVHHNNIDEGRRTSVASVNLNKNLDAKYVNIGSSFPINLMILVESPILS
jgi:hypothetical protein